MLAKIRQKDIVRAFGDKTGRDYASMNLEVLLVTER